MTKYHALMWYFCVLTIQSYDCYIVCCEAVVTVTFFFWRWSLIVLVWDITNEPVGLTIETIKRSNWNDSYWLLCPAVRWLLNRTLFSVLRSGAGYLLCCLNNSYGPFIVLCLNPPQPPPSDTQTRQWVYLKQRGPCSSYVNQPSGNCSYSVHFWTNFSLKLDYPGGNVWCGLSSERHQGTNKLKV